MPLSGKSNHSRFPKDFEEEGGRPVLGKHFVNVGNRKKGKTRKIWANAWKTNVFARTENVVWELFFFSCLNSSMFFFFYKKTHHLISNETNECPHEQLNIWTTNTFTAHLTWNRVSKSSKKEDVSADGNHLRTHPRSSGRCLIQTLNFDLNWPRPGPCSDLPVWQVYFWYSPAATTLPCKISGSTTIAMCVCVCVKKESVP